jgi:peptide/nickel transport system substrate-binding protein
MKKYLVILVGFLLILELSGCLEESQSNEEIQSISIAIDQDIVGFYPWVKSYEIYTVLVNRNIYNSLVEFDEIFRINPCLAKSWNNPDDYTWNFYLRENVTFHNGYKFTSKDVKYTIDLIRENGSESNQLQTLLKLVKQLNLVLFY